MNSLPRCGAWAAALIVTTAVAVLPAQDNPAQARPQPPAPAAHERADQSDAGGVPSPRASENDAGYRDEFDRIDTDRDGRVSPKEYASSDLAAIDMVASGKRSGTEAPRGGFDLRNNEGRPDRSTFFRRLDTDKDGYLSRDEVEVANKPR